MLNIMDSVDFSFDFRSMCRWRLELDGETIKIAMAVLSEILWVEEIHLGGSVQGCLNTG